MLTIAYGESTLSKKNVYKWYKLFQEGRENVEDEPRPGRPSTSTTDENVEAVKEIVLKNRRITIREVAEDVGISVGSCYDILSDVLGMRRVSVKFVPKFLNFDQKNRRMTIAQEMLNEVNEDPNFLKSPNGRPQKSQHPKKHAKFDQLSRFCSLSSLITVA